MPARLEEVENAMEEGVIFDFLTAPTRFLGEGGMVRAMEVVDMELGEPEPQAAGELPIVGRARSILCRWIQ